MSNAVAFEVQPGDPRERDPGAYYFVIHPTTKERLGITHACPCGCRGLSLCWFRGKGPVNGDAEWDVIGEWPKVTMNPSIGVKYDGRTGQKPPTGYHWHGYLRNGVFEEC